MTPLIAAALALVLAFSLTDGGPSTTNTTVTSRVFTVPRFKGLTLTNARSLARLRNGRVYVVVRAPSQTAEGTVVSQSLNSSWPVGLVVSSGPWRDDKAVLPGERTPPVRPECARAVWLSQDGNAYPLLCSGNRVNVGAWLFYARNHPSMMSIARSVPISRVIAALCRYTVGDPKGFNDGIETLPEQESVFTLAPTYNGWKVPKGHNCAQHDAMSK